MKLWDEDGSDDRTAERLNDAITRMNDRQVLFRFFAIMLVANLLIWICVLIFPEPVYHAFQRVNAANDKLSKVVLALVFGVGMFLAYSGLRFKFPDVEEQNLDSDVMATYAYQAHSTRRWFVWLGSTAFGIVNLLLLIVVTIWLNS